jgi:thioredoxin 1
MKTPAKIVIVLFVVLAVAAAMMLKRGKLRSPAADTTHPANITHITATTEASTAAITTNVATTTATEAGGATPVEQSPAGENSAVIRLPKLLDLGATQCIPCKMMAPILEELKKEYAGRMEVEFIDVWKNEDAGKPYGVRSIPTQIFYDANGKELFRHTGFFSKEDILAKWKELGYLN